MIRTYIDKLIDPIPEEYVRQIRRLDNEPDYSFTCLGIALLKPRIENYNGVCGEYKSGYDEQGCARAFIDHAKKYDGDPMFCYYMFRHNFDLNQTKDLLQENEFVIKNNISTFVKTKTGAECIAVYHKEKNIAGIIVNTSDVGLYHIIITFISLLYPNLFTDKPLTENDYNVIKSLSSDDSKAFIQRVQEAVQPYAMDFKRLMLNGLLKSMHKTKIEQARRVIDVSRSEAENLLERYAAKMREYKNNIIIYEGMKATEQYDKNEEDLVEYLSTNKSIHNMTIRNNTLYFSVATLLNNYNADAWRIFKERGYIYDGKYTHEGKHRIVLLDVFKDKQNRKLLLDNIFSETPDFTVKIAGNYSLDLNGCCVCTRANYDYNMADPIYQSYMPNPHLKIFACLGGYESRVNEALKNRNYIGAIEMCCASAASVDLDETEQTFRPFIGWLMMSREKVLRRKDGVDMTPEEALLYIIDKEKENESN